MTFTAYYRPDATDLDPTTIMLSRKFAESAQLRVCDTRKTISNSVLQKVQSIRKDVFNNIMSKFGYPYAEISKLAPVSWIETFWNHQIRSGANLAISGGGGCPGGKCIKSYILFLYRHVHLYNAPFDLKIGVLVLQASVRKWEMNILHICIISMWFSNTSSRLSCFTKVSLLRR